MTSRLATVMVACVLLLRPAPAAADWLLTPFLGTTFAANIALVSDGLALSALEPGAGQTKWTVGTSFTLLSDGILGVEADIGHTPGFLQGDLDDGVVVTSRLTTFMGNVILAAPLELTRESLRPYVAGGVGLMQVRSKNVADVFSVDRGLAAFSIGAGAIGFVSERTGVRFDVRYLRGRSSEDVAFPAAGVTRLSFWRASVGVTIRLLL